jgi:outer membrane protein assembly factor BamA
MKKKVYTLVLSLFVFQNALSFQTNEESADTAKAESQGILPVPIFYYTPETGIAGGAGALYFARAEGSPVYVRPSATALLLIYTERKQFIAQLSGEWYLHNGRYRLDNDLLFMRYPQKFYGLGNDTPDSLEENYTSELFRYEFKALHALAQGLNVGFTGLFEARRFTELSPTGQLATARILGSQNGITSGIGPLVTLDSRDNIFAPQHGIYHLFSVVTFHQNLGSDFRFTKSTVNLRQYLLVADQQVLALQLYGSFISGSAPFHKLAELGGQSQMRGYYEGRYRDKHYITAQAEYRTPLFWRIGFIAFAGFGDVANEIRLFNLRELKPSYGIGFRYFFSIQERLNLRLDFGFGNNSSGMYIGPQESF